MSFLDDRGQADYFHGRKENRRPCVEKEIFHRNEDR